MFGFDSRAAMVPGGAAEGFGNLGAALLLSPQIRRRDQDEERRYQDGRNDHQKQLDQALLIAHMTDANDRARISSEDRYRDEELNLRKGEAAHRDAIDWAKTLGNAINGIIPRASGASAGPQYKPEPWKDVTETDADGKTFHRKVLKSPEEIDQERALFERGRNGPPKPATPQAPDSGVVAERKARNAQVQRDQRTQGLAQGPGDRKPLPSTANAPTRTKEKLLSKVGPGGFPTLEAAYQDATSRGYVVQGL